MKKNFYLVTVGILNDVSENYYNLRQSNLTNTIFDDYVECQKYLFSLVDYYKNHHDQEYTKRVIVSMELHYLKDKVDRYRGSYYEKYFYYYRGIHEKGAHISLSFTPEQFSRMNINSFHSLNRIDHYIPKEKDEEYKQALMEYRLLNK